MKEASCLSKTVADKAAPVSVYDKKKQRDVASRSKKRRNITGVRARLASDW